MSIALSLPPQAAFAVEMAAKATLVLAATAAVAGVVALRRGSAAARHLVWTLGVCGVLALPLLSAALPGWRTPLVTLPGPALDVPPARAADPSIVPTSPVSQAAATTGVDPTVVVSSGEAAGTGGMGLGTVAVFIYLTGLLAVLGRLAIGRWSVGRLARQARPVTDAAWTALLRDVAWELELRRPVRLLRGGGATMPMTWGIARPAVLLPAECGEWPEERRRVVLMHELAHVARHDCLTQTLAAAACALYWFHPAAWHAARRLRVERELACDDRVLQAGTRARDYAAHLLEVARAFRPAPLSGAVAVSMARPSQLEGRLLAVLDGVRDRRTITRPAAWVAAALALAVILPLAAIRPGSAQQAVPAGVTFGGPRPWKDAVKTRPARSSDAYPDLDAALRQGGTDITLSARPGERLTLELPEQVSARVEAWDRPSVHVRVDDRGLHVRAVRDANGPHVTVTGRPRTDGVEPQVRIQAPRNFNVHTQADGGGLEIGALNGTFTGSVTRGGVAFVGTRGTVRMVAHGGGAYVSRTHLDGRLEMDGGGALVDRNTGNLDVHDAAAIAHGQAGNLHVTVPARAQGSTRGGDDEEVACNRDACTISAARAGASSGRGTTIYATTASGQGGGEGWTAASPARASTIARSSTIAATVTSGPATTVAIGGEPGRAVAVGVGRSGTTTAGSTYTVAGDAGEGYATTITAGDGATTRDRDGYAYTTGNVEERIAAVRAMARNAPPPAAAAGLGNLAFSEREAAVQRAAVEELSRLRTPAAREQLRRIARDHARAAVRAQAEAALR